MTFRFYLGTHQVSWLWDARFITVPLFVSRRRLVDRVAVHPPATTSWALDSGGFTELSLHGRWTVSAQQYVDEVRTFSAQLGRLQWCAPQDWMCEPQITAKTGLSVLEHQQRTVENLLELRARAPELVIVPVLQGFVEADYLRCIELYARAGIDLRDEPLVGLGTICRRQGTDEAAALVSRLVLEGLKLHAFGAKITGLRRYAPQLRSSDSLAWSLNARKHPPMEGCSHKSCGNCPRWALRWRRRVLDGIWRRCFA